MIRRVPIFSLALAAAWMLAACTAAADPTASPVPSTATAASTAAATLAPTTAPATVAPTVLAPTVAPCVIAACTATPAAATPGQPALTVPAPTDLPATEGPTSAPSTVPATSSPTAPQAAEAILILSPGDSSSVTSPVHVTGEADPTFEQNLVIQISDANGTVLATQPTTIRNGGAGRGTFEADVPFKLSLDIAGRISVFSTSARDGGLTHLASVAVMLSNSDVATLVVVQPHGETHLIAQPTPQASVVGGTLHVSGFSDYVFEGQLGVELCGEGGSGAPDPICGTVDNVLATGTAALQSADVGQPGPFAGDLAYHVSAPVQARLAVFSRSARDGGLVHLSSVSVQLNP